MLNWNISGISELRSKSKHVVLHATLEEWKSLRIEMTSRIYNFDLSVFVDARETNLARVMKHSWQEVVSVRAHWCQQRHSATMNKCQNCRLGREKKLRLGYTALPPFVYKSGPNLDGIIIDMWRIIADKMNLKPEFVHTRILGNIRKMVIPGL